MSRDDAKRGDKLKIINRSGMTARHDDLKKMIVTPVAPFIGDGRLFNYSVLYFDRLIEFSNKLMSKIRTVVTKKGRSTYSPCKEKTATVQKMLVKSDISE